MLGCAFTRLLDFKSKTQKVTVLLPTSFMLVEIMFIFQLAPIDRKQVPRTIDVLLGDVFYNPSLLHFIRDIVGGGGGSHVFVVRNKDTGSAGGGGDAAVRSERGTWKSDFDFCLHNGIRVFGSVVDCLP